MRLEEGFLILDFGSKVSFYFITEANYMEFFDIIYVSSKGEEKAWVALNVIVH